MFCFKKVCFVAFALAGVLVVSMLANDMKDAPQQSKNVMELPAGILPVKEGQLLGRRVPGGWQLCRIKRFVLQELLVPLQSQGKVVGLMREADTKDSALPSEHNAVFVVLEVSKGISDALASVKSDEHSLAELNASDEVIVKLATITETNFSVLTR
jgi:hypothetical protein